MLNITAVNDDSIKAECKSENAVILMCSEDGVEKGYIAFEQIGYILHIVGMQVYYSDGNLSNESHIIADTLMKSLGNYAMNHSCFYIQCSKEELYPMLKKFSFAENDNYLTTNLQQLFKVCKN